jgi:hypothetical protein
MLEKIKMLLGIAEEDEGKDDLINLLISLCKDEAVDFCNLPEYDSKLDSAVISMVIERYNARGTEGLSSVSGSGVNEHYKDGYSSNIISALIKNRKIRCI